MDKKLSFYIFLSITIFLILNLKNGPIAKAEDNNNSDTDNSNKLVIPLPFNSHIADQTIDDEKRYAENILPFQ